MSLALGIYDVFSYMIPGGLYLFVFIYAAGWLKTIQQINVGIWQGILFLGVAYITGVLFDPLATKVWYYRFFALKDLHSAMLKKLKQNNPNLEISFDEKQWAVIMSYVAIRDGGEDHVERYSTLKIMLRNISFGLLIFATVQLVQFFVNQYNIWNILICISSFFFSIIAGIESRKFDQWAISKAFETFVAEAIDPKSFVKLKPKKRSK